MIISPIQTNYNYSIKPQKSLTRTVQPKLGKPCKNVSFEGMSRILGSQTIDHFLKHAEIVGETTIYKKYNLGFMSKFLERFFPIKVVVVKCNRPKFPESTIFSLFEKGFEKSKTLAELDSKELGIMEVMSRKTKDIGKFYLPKVNEYRSHIHLKRTLPENYLQIEYLASFEGIKYHGIGTQLLNIATEESQKRGFGGNITLFCLNDIPADYLKHSKYFEQMKQEKPTPFYYKFGLTSDPETNEIVKKKDYYLDRFYMYLPDDKRQKLLLELKKTPILR